MPTRSDIIRARRRAVGGRRPRCRRGKSCSAACINQNKHCLVDAPTPVEGALPRAVKAIQTRREKLGRKEKKQVLEKRREYVKGNILSKALNRASVSMDEALSSGDLRKYKEEESRFISIRDRLKREGSNSIPFPILAYSPGQRLSTFIYKLKEEMNRAIQSKDVSRYDKAESVLRKIDPSVNKRKMWREFMIAGEIYPLHEKMHKAIMSNDRAKYNKLESLFFRLHKKTGYDPQVSRGELWRSVKGQEGTDKIREVVSKLEKDMMEAIANNDRRRYDKAEARLLRIRNKTGGSYESSISSGKGKGVVWRDENLSKAIERTSKQMDEALLSGNLEKYRGIESKLMKILNKLSEESPDKVPPMFRMYRPGSRQAEIYETLISEMRMAAVNGDAGKYDKSEKILMKIDPERNRRELWRQIRVENLVNLLNKQIEQAVRSNDRREYNKLESRLMRVGTKIGNVGNFNISGLSKGEMWRRHRLIRGEQKIKDTVRSLEKEMLKAISENDRERYDRVEARLFRIRDKLGRFESTLTYGKKKGEIWAAQVGPTELMKRLKESDLLKGGREGVSNIELIPSKGNYINVLSNVLGNELSISLSPHGTSFRVNDSYMANNSLPRREKVAITREVKRQYGEIVSSLKDGTVLGVTAVRGDDRGDAREEAYIKFGFSPPNRDGSMFGVVRGGKVFPISEDEYKRNLKGHFQ